MPRSSRPKLIAVAAASALLSALGSLMVIGLIRQRDLEKSVAAARAESEARAAEARTEANAARRARDQAEELVRFIFEDLRDELEPVGRTEVVESVAQKALAYYENLPPELRTPEGEERRAMLLEEIALCQYEQGKLAECEASHRAAIRLFESLAGDADPASETHYSLAHAWTELAYLFHAQGDLDAADEAYRAALQIVEAALAGGGAGDADWVRERAKILFGFGESERLDGDYAEAVAQYRKALPDAEQALALAPDDPQVLRSAAHIYNNLGYCHTSLAQFPEAEEAYEKGVALERRTVALEPDMVRWKRELATSLNNVGTLFDKMGEHDRALPYLEESLEARRALTEWDPANIRWMENYANSHHNMAMWHLDLEHFADAKAAMEDAVATYARAVALSPSDPGPPQELGSSLRAADKYWRQAGRTGDLLELMRAAEAALAPFEPAGGKVGDLLAEVRDRIGRLVAVEGGAEAASAHARGLLAMALARFDPGAADGQPPEEGDFWRLAWAFANAAAAENAADRHLAAASLARFATVASTRLEPADDTDRALESHARSALDEALAALGKAAPQALVPRGSALAALGNADLQVLVPRGSAWRYWDRGAPPDGWRDPDFDDADWPEGKAELGYGDGGEATEIGFGGDKNAKHLAAYFRLRFNGPPAGATDLRLAVLRDDGAAVYLNGEEILRDGFPPGQPIRPGDPTNQTVRDQGETIFRLAYFKSLPLRDGENVLAVEVHQNEAISSDLSFDLELQHHAPKALAALDEGDFFAAEMSISRAIPAAVKAWLSGQAQP
ncbi:MAG: tetratricopeptide repeat protein [Verrucomicrobiales bacterium]